MSDERHDEAGPIDEVREELPRPTPFLMIDEYEGSLYVTIPSRNVFRLKVKSLVYGCELDDGRQIWHVLGPFMENCDAVATVVENSPGMASVVTGIIEARAARRFERARQWPEGARP